MKEFFFFIILLLSHQIGFAQIEHCTDISSPTAPCYRYSCDSISNTGQVYDDGCPVNCEDKPSHWASNIVQVRVSSDRLPEGNPSISTSEWNQIVDESLDAWSQVPGSNFNFQRSTILPLREYGTQENSHEIFWINSRSEWQEKIQASVHSTLGITVSHQGTCDRLIQDSDLVMNAAGISSWSANKADCQASGYIGCRNAKVTLLHELGHFVGIGHPCSSADCLSWSIMAAVANPYAEKESLQIADHAVMSKLYPGTIGGIGSSCERPNDTCNPPLSCKQVGPLQYCTKECDSVSKKCTAGLICDQQNTGLCVFEGSIEAKIGEHCYDLGQFCADNKGVCVSSGEQNLCLKVCSVSENNCKSREQCINISDSDPNLGVCSPKKANCNPNNGAGCELNEHCIYPISRCLPGKDILSEGGCPGDTLCPSDAFCPNQAFCSITGNGLEGASCDGNNVLNCALGNICLAPSNNPDKGLCYHRCDQKFECSAGQECRDLSDRVNPNEPFLSYCADNGTLQTDAGFSLEEPNNPTNEEINCRSERGHFDCGNGELCFENTCIPSSSQKKDIGYFCDAHNECEGGICANGICSQPCNYGNGCGKSFKCLNDELLNGEVCTPQNCSNTGCDEEFNCLLSPKGKYFCSAENIQSCDCDQSKGSFPIHYYMLLSVLLFVFTLRKK